ncbi:hypothetical protein GCM10008929_16270 [Alkalibacterium psychrotolerans]
MISYSNTCKTQCYRFRKYSVVKRNLIFVTICSLLILSEMTNVTLKFTKNAFVTGNKRFPFRQTLAK